MTQDALSSPSEIAEQKTESDFWWHLSFGALLAASAITFGLWAYGSIGQTTHYWVLALTIIFGLFMAFNIGGNDVANSFGTSVGAKTLTMKQALVIAAIFEVGGAILAGGEVTETVRNGIVDLHGVNLQPMDFVFIMMAALLGAALWLLIATQMGWPVSTTHSIVGGIVGAAVTIGHRTNTGGWNIVQWDQIGEIAMSWILSPLLGGIVAYFLFLAIQRGILVYNQRADEQLEEIRQERAEHKKRHKASFERLSEMQQLAYTTAMVRDAEISRRRGFDRADLESDYFRELYELDDREQNVNAFRALQLWVPLLASLGAMMITAMMLFKGLKNLHLNIDNVGNIMIIGMIGAGVWMAVRVFARTIRNMELSRATFIMFSWMQVFTAAAFAFSHGSNDIANAVGPIAAILDVLHTGSINAKAAVPPILLVCCGVALVSGLWFIGRKVITTVGSGLTRIHPASGFAAELAAATVVMGASVLGLPVSSTHILIGAILGVGMVTHSANWGLMRPIALAWVITIPAAAGIGALGVLVLRLIFG